MDNIIPLTKEQMKQFPKEPSKSPNAIRFLANGQAIEICSGVCCSKYSNIMYHPVYWDKSKIWIKTALKFLRENNPDIKFRVTYH